MTKSIRQPMVAIIGKPNVGKSTLFNRLVGRRVAITSEVSGTTRDRLTAQINWLGVAFDLIDSAGMQAVITKQELEINIAKQAESALLAADIIIFITDGRGELDKDDLDVADKLRGSDKPIFLVVNKLDNLKLEQNLAIFYKLGLGEPIPISAIHGLGITELLDKIVAVIKKLKFKTTTVKDEGYPKSALVGRPNVGKSTLFNYIIGEDRAVVSSVPGTTRDTLDTKITINNKKYLFLDTAGLRRRGKIQRGIEKFSVLRTMKAIRDCDIAIVILDAEEGPVRGDVHIATFALEAGKKIIFAVNKIDLVENRIQNINRFPSLAKLPWVVISAKTGQGVKKLFKLMEEQQD